MRILYKFVLINFILVINNVQTKIDFVNIINISTSREDNVYIFINVNSFINAVRNRLLLTLLIHFYDKTFNLILIR